jgi:hypothetical protein
VIIILKNIYEISAYILLNQNYTAMSVILRLKGNKMRSGRMRMSSLRYILKEEIDTFVSTSLVDVEELRCCTKL